MQIADMGARLGNYIIDAGIIISATGFVAVVCGLVFPEIFNHSSIYIKIIFAIITSCIILYLSYLQKGR